jgi:hypothetical protein
MFGMNMLVPEFAACVLTGAAAEPDAFFAEHIYAPKAKSPRGFFACNPQTSANGGLGGEGMAQVEQQPGLLNKRTSVSSNC